MNRTIYTLLLLSIIIATHCQTEQPQLPQSQPQQPQPQQQPQQPEAQPQSERSQTPEMTKTQQKRLEEQEKLHRFFSENTDVKNLNKEFNFQIQRGAEEFVFHLSADHLVLFMLRSYYRRDGVYTHIESIQAQPPTHLVVYENNHKIIAEDSFHFFSTLKISGKQGNTYSLRFYSKSLKLVTISHNNFIQVSHLQDKIKSNKMEQQGLLLTSVDNKLELIFKELRFGRMLEMESRKMLVGGIEGFSRFVFAEIGVVIVVCLVQVRMLAGLLKNDSIV